MVQTILIICLKLKKVFSYGESKSSTIYNNLDDSYTYFQATKFQQYVKLSEIEQSNITLVIYISSGILQHANMIMLFH